MLLKLLTTATISLLTLSSAFAESNPHSIQVKGSDTMVNLSQAWAETYMKEHPQAYIAVTGGGSGTGIAALLGKTCEIALSSRNIKSKEIDEAAKNNVVPKEFKVALDGLVVVVSTKNPVDQLTVDQVAGIYSGKITNWKEVGGDDLEIVVLSREVNSGTHVYFREHIVQREGKNKSEEFTDAALLMPSSQAIADEISQNPNAVGYYGMGYVNPTQKALRIAKDNASPYISPSIDNVKNGSYYISRPLLLYTNGEPSGIVKDFIDFTLSPRGQEIVKEIDFVPVK